MATNPRLLALLDRAMARPIIWLQGPPGAGKTTLAADWLAARGVDPIWQRLDAEDSDASSLFFNLGMAEARARGGDATRRLPLLTPEYRFGTAAFSRNCFRILFEGAPTSLIVFDDYHELDADSPVHELLAGGMKEIPNGGHILVVSRLAPPKEFARLRVNGAMEVLAPEQLLLRAEEAQAILEARGARLDEGQLQNALDLTHGWTAGLVLLLESARNTVCGQPEFPAEPELLFDYFAGEVLRGFAEADRRTLIGLALLPSMTAKAAELHAEDPNAGALLERLSRRGYFTTRDGAAEPHYRFHPLFRRFLIAEAQKSFSADHYRQLQLRAARILEECLQPDAAVALLRETAAWDELARLLKAWAERIEATGRLKTLASWIETLPPARVDADGWLLYWAAVAKTPFQPIDGRQLFHRALADFTAKGDADGAFLAASRLVSSIIMDDLADQPQLDPLIAALRDLVARFPGFSSPAIETDVAYALCSALSRRTSNRKEIAYWRGRALAAVAQSGDALPGVVVRMGCAIFALMDGQFEIARAELANLPDAEALSDSPYQRSVRYYTAIMAQFNRQAPGDCVQTASIAYRHDAAAGVTLYTGLNAALAAMDCVSAGDFTQAKTWLQRSSAHTDRLSSRRNPMYHVARAMFDCATGNMADAEREARCAVETASAVNFSHHEAISRLALVQLLLLSGQFAGIGDQLAATEAALNHTASHALHFRLGMSRAAWLLKSGRRDEGLDVLRAALAEAENIGARRISLIRPLASSLLSEALAHDFSPAYVRQLIQLESLPPPENDDAHWPTPVRIVTLGVFRLFRDGEPVQLSRKTPRRLFDLVKAIAAFGGRDIPQEKIIDALWPDEDGDKARQSFDVAVHRLRKLLGDARTIVVKGGRIGFDPARCSLDIWSLQNACACRNPPSDAAERGLRLYRGDFLAEEPDLPWAASQREKLRALFIRAVETQASASLASGDPSRAADLYLNGIRARPDAEAL